MTASTTFSPTDVAALRDRVTGRVLARGDLPDGGPTAAEAVAAHSTLVAHDPDVAVLAETEADVVEAVRFAAHHGLPVRSHATGHGESSPITDGLVLGTSGLAGVEVDPATRIARIGAGRAGARSSTRRRSTGSRPSRGRRPPSGSSGTRSAAGTGP